MTSMFSVAAFCAQHSVSRSLFYRLLKDGRGPRLTKVSRRTSISSESAAEWRAQMERETVALGRTFGAHSTEVGSLKSKVSSSR